MTLHYIAAEMSGETFLISAKRPVYFNAEQFRTDAKCTQDIIVLGGWELESKRWFSLKLDRTQVPYLFKPDGGGAQWASTSAELLASLCALVAFGWLSPTTARRTVALALSAGTDNMANEFLSSKRAHNEMAPHADQHAVIGAVGQGKTELEFEVAPTRRKRGGGPANK